MLNLIKFEVKKIFSNKTNVLLIIFMIFSYSFTSSSTRLTAEHINGYPDWLEEKVDSDSNIVNSSLSQFAMSDREIEFYNTSFNMYSQVQSNLETFNDIGQNIAYFNDSESGLIILAIGFILGVVYISIDKDYKMNLIVNSSNVGYKKNSVSGIIAYIIMVILVVLLSLSLRYAIYPFNGSAPIQHSSMFMYSAYSISLIQLLLIKVVLMIIGTVTIMLLTISCYYIFKSKSRALVFTLMFVIIELILFYSINSKSYLLVLKDINIINFFNLTNLFATLNITNLLIFNVNTFVFLVVLFSLLMLVLVFIIINNNNYIESETGVMNSLLITKSPHSSMFFETLKLFIKQGALIICLLGIIVGFFVFKSNEFIDNTTYHYHRYAELIQGEITKETEAIINGERLYYEEVLLEQSNLEDLTLTGTLDYFEYEQRSKDIESKLSGFLAFQEIENDLLLTQERNQQMFLNQRVYSKLIDINLWLNIVLLVSIVSSVSLFSLGSYEYENKMYQIFSATLTNFKEINKNKVKLVISLTSIMTLILSVFLLLAVFGNFGSLYLMANVKSILSINSPISMSILMFILLLFVIVFIINTIISLSVFYISHKSKSSISALGVGMVICVLVFLLKSILI